MSRNMLAVNALSVCIAAILCLGLVRVLWHRPELPAPRPPSPVATRLVQDSAPAMDRSSLSGYLVIATKSVFSPTRSESESPLGQLAAGPKPILHGVVIGGPSRRAYLEDPLSKRVVSYGVGDTIPGGRLDRIEEDRVIIVGTGGALEVLLQDPGKPKAPAITPGSPAQAPAVPSASMPLRQLTAPPAALPTPRVPETGAPAPTANRFYFGDPVR